MEFGPVQVLVVGFEDGEFSGEILAELQGEGLKTNRGNVIARQDWQRKRKDDAPDDEVEPEGILAGSAR